MVRSQRHEDGQEETTPSLIVEQRGRQRAYSLGSWSCQGFKPPFSFQRSELDAMERRTEQHVYFSQKKNDE